MAKTAIISVDGHVKASRAGYRDYIQGKFLQTYDEWVRAAEEAGIPDAGNLNPEYGADAQWDSQRRLQVLEGQGVVAEVLFPNGQPFQINRFEDAARADDVELAGEGRQAYNRWLVDFCAEAPGRRSGQAVVSFDDVDQAVKDVYWAKERGLGGIMMPPLNPGGKDFFDPVLDPIWAAVQEVGLPLSQHGGAGLPGYSAPGFAAILTVSIENGFFSVRSLWQMIAGGVFDRFPGLRMASVEMGSDWVRELLRKLKKSFGQAPGAYREDPVETFRRHVWVSPFHEEDLRGMADLVGVERMLMGSDFPHAEGIAVPGDYVHELKGFSPREIRLVMRENALALAAR